jgi:hypothetical protein
MEAENFENRLRMMEHKMDLTLMMLEALCSVNLSHKADVEIYRKQVYEVIGHRERCF